MDANTAVPSGIFGASPNPAFAKLRTMGLDRSVLVDVSPESLLKRKARPTATDATAFATAVFAGARQELQAAANG